MKNSSQETTSDSSDFLSDAHPDTDSASGPSEEGQEEDYRNISASSHQTDKDSKYFLNLPANLNIFSGTSDVIQKIADSDKQKDVVKILQAFQNVLLEKRFALDTIGSLPPLQININKEDDSVLIEWIFRDFRIGFSIEANRSQSNWYLVSNQNLNQLDYSGLLPWQDLDELLTTLIAFVLSNT